MTFTVFLVDRYNYSLVNSGYCFQTTDSADFLATRPHTAAVLPGKPAGNPLQFVRVGPADLGSRAREQLRRAELAKRTEPSRIERQEDWQSVSKHTSKYATMTHHNDPPLTWSRIKEFLVSEC